MNWPWTTNASAAHRDSDPTEYPAPPTRHKIVPVRCYHPLIDQRGGTLLGRAG